VLILGGNQLAAGGYEVANSCRFDDGSTDYLNRTFSSDTNRTTYTISVWIKRSKISDETFIIAADVSAGAGNTRDFVRIESNDQLRYTIGGGAAADVKTTQVLRDVSAWYHIIVAVDTTQATSSNRVKIYINGNQVTDFATSSYPAQNHVGDFNDNILHRVGMDTNNTSNGWNGYMSEFVFIDGSQLDPTSFGEFDEDTGIWKPISVSGLTFGTNGFYLPFENSAALGQDDSGNGNNFTVNNLTSIDQTTDTPTNNYATFNPLIYNPAQANYNPLFSNGNTTGASNTTVNAFSNARATLAMTSGKWYAEFKITSTDSNMQIGLINYQSGFRSTNNWALWYQQDGAVSFEASGSIYINNSLSGTSFSGYTTGDIMQVAFDRTSEKVWLGKNGTWFNSGDPSNGTNELLNLSSTIGDDEFWTFAVGFYHNNSEVWDANFGNPTFTISSGNSDGNGYGNFEYAVPSGYYALNTKNLAEYG